MAAYPDPPPVILLPESVVQVAQAARRPRPGALCDFVTGVFVGNHVQGP